MYLKGFPKNDGHDAEEIKEQFRKRVVLAKSPSFRVLVLENIRVYLRSGFGCGEHPNLTPFRFFGAGEHPNVPLF